MNRVCYFLNKLFQFDLFSLVGPLVNISSCSLRTQTHTHNMYIIFANIVFSHSQSSTQLTTTNFLSPPFHIPIVIYFPIEPPSPLISSVYQLDKQKTSLHSCMCKSPMLSSMVHPRHVIPVSHAHIRAG
jgi:hypothetical protein